MPWQFALATAFGLFLLFCLLLILSLVVSFFGWSFIISSILLMGSFLLIVLSLPIFLNLSRSFFWLLFLSLFLQILVTIFTFALHHWNSGILNSNGEIIKSFSVSIYFSITTFTTLGYGDFQPLPHMRFATSIEALAGMVSIAIGASLIWLWCLENLVPKEIAFFDGDRRPKNSLAIHRMRIRTITGKERQLDEYDLPPKSGATFRHDKERNEWVEVTEGEKLQENELILEMVRKNNSE